MSSPQSPASPRGMASMSRPIIQSMPDTRQQSFEEIYGPPENFLEIEVGLVLLLSHATSNIYMSDYLNGRC
jgi:sorting nexin-3/12